MTKSVEVATQTEESAPVIDLTVIPVGTLSQQDLIALAINNRTLPEGFGAHLDKTVPKKHRMNTTRGESPSMGQSAQTAHWNEPR